MTTDRPEQPRKSFLRRHPILTGLTAIVVILLGLTVVAVITAARWDYRPIAEQQASALLGRRVSIGTLVIHWNNPLAHDPVSLEIADLRVANASWGSTPHMVTIKHITAAADLPALLHGVLRFSDLKVDTPVIVLERDDKGTGNWLFKGTSQPADPVTNQPQTEVVPSGRTNFPVLLDFGLTNGRISYRGFSGHVLTIDLHEVTIATTGDDQPVTIKATGAYNGADLALQVETGSFRDLHDSPKPLKTKVSLTRPASQLTFDGTMTDPINADGADGALEVKTGKLSDLLGIFHTSLSLDPAVDLKGHLTRQSDLWHLTKAQAQIGGQLLTGEVTLTEGRRGASDDIKLNLNTEQLDIDKLMAVTGKKDDKKNGTSDWQTIKLETPDKTAPRIAADARAAAVIYQGKSINDLHLAGKLAPGAISLDSARLSYQGVPLDLSASMTAAGKGSRVKTTLMLRDADFQTLAKALGSATTDLSGQINGGLDLTLQGVTLGDAMKTASGAAVLSLMSGRVSRDLLEKASIDLRNLFRKGEGTARLTCLLAVMRIENGIGQLTPLRLRSSAATLNGQGRVDFANKKLDITLQSDHRSTDFLALDIPVRLSGAWDNPSIDLLGKSGSVGAAEGTIGDLPPALQGIAAANSCRN